MNVGLKGGKTAPRLLLDLAQYDPRKLSASGFNVLTDVPFHDEGRHDPAPPLPPRGSCHHQWALKRNQCELPDGKDYTPSLVDIWRFAAFCTRCGSHLEVKIDFLNKKEALTPCPTEERPLHHFMHQPEFSVSRQELDKIQHRNGTAWVDTHCFRCTSQHCSARLIIELRPPRLSADWVTQLTDRYVIKTRAEKVMAQDPEKFEGVAIPSPSTVIDNLSTHIRNAMYDPEHSKEIKRENKKFATCFGDSCSDLLEYLGFVKEEAFWVPPRPDPDQEKPYKNHFRILLDDVKHELQGLRLKEPAQQASQLEFAEKELKIALACVGYKQTPRARTVDLTIDEHPFYAGLGAAGDFHDELVGFAYERQIACDGQNTPYYLECLQAIAVGRDDSEDLHTKAAIEETMGRISLKDIRLAYSRFNLNIGDPQLADETIIGTFQARISDAPKQETEMRKDLRIIGEHRSSERIRLVASQDVTTYEQALAFLTADDTTIDEFIPSMAGVRIGEKPSDESTARQAVAIIANHRKSKALKTWLDTGTLGDSEMDIGQAYTRLNVMDRTVGDELILTSYNLIIDEQPSQMYDLNRALTAIAKSRNSAILKGRLSIDDDEGQHKLSEWPVGIENIGNTCYLNSLLQFYFTIKPLRDLVLNVNNFKMTVDEQNLRSKRVGSRNVSKKEVDRAQRFVDELQRLFQDLINSPKTSLKPNPDVARLTLLSSNKAELARRQSMIVAERPTLGSLGHVNGLAVHGPVGPPQSQSDQNDTEMSDKDVDSTASKGNANEAEESDTSSDTLIDTTTEDAMAIDPQSTDMQKRIFEDKENLPPLKTDLNPEIVEEFQLQPPISSSSSRLNEQANNISENLNELEMPRLSESKDNGVEPAHADSSALPPNRPPPFPPRPQHQRNTSDAIKEAEYGAQQDVTEVIANVLFQLQCAIKPEAIDETGEQLDQVKRLFFGKSKSYTTDRKGTIRTKEEYMSDIKIDVASGPRDIYDALDGAFDVQDVEVGGGIEPQYATISQLPPVLSVLIQRAQFDPEKKTTFKSENHLELKETIYMDRYMDSSDPSLNERRQESWAWKRQLAVLEKRRAQLVSSDMGMDMPETLAATRAYLQQVKELNDEEVEIPESLMENIEDAAKECQEELEALKYQIKDLRTNISSQFSDLRTIPYRLASVFIHVGSHNTGHYWIYIYDFGAKIWRKYNDEKVTEVRDTKEIFEAPGTTRPPTPYYLVYVKAESKEPLVDPVCRDVSDLLPEEVQDTVMEDYTDINMPNITSDMIEDTYAALNRPRTQQEQMEHDGNWNASSTHKPGIQW